MDSSELYNLYRDACSDDVLGWGKMFLSHHFRISSPNFHVRMLHEAVNNRFLAVASPRESAKSTLLVFLYPFHQIIFKKKRFIVIVSNTFKKAAMHLDTIKKELIDNKMIKGQVLVTKDAEGDSEFRHQDGFETKVLCRGVDQIGGIRGVKFGAYRPDLIIGDDMEDDELVRSVERREKLTTDFDTALIPAGEKGLCQYIFVGTVLHDDCQLAKLINPDHYPEYHKLIFKALRKNGQSLWPEKWSLEYLEQLKKDKPVVFAKEYQNDPVAGGNVRFLRENFRYWKEENNNAILLDKDGSKIATYDFKELKCAIACDLAFKERRESDSSVIMPGYITPNHDILIENYIHKKGIKPDEICDIILDLVERLKNKTSSNVPVGFEKAMLENVTQWLLKKSMQQSGNWIITKELKWDADKLTRIETRLEPRYSQKIIYHKHGMGDLEHQLERFPHGTHDDLIDAEQGLIQLLQYPKQKRTHPQEDDLFMKLRQSILDVRQPKKVEKISSRPKNTIAGLWKVTKNPF